MDASIPNKPCPRRIGGGSGHGTGRRRYGGLLPVLALLLAAGSPPAALGAEKPPAANRLAAEARLTPESAAGIARRETGGRVLSVTPMDGAERGYRVRLLLDGGRVTTVVVGSRGGIESRR